MPAEAVFRTRPQQVAVMIERALKAGVPFAWFAADEEFGQNPGLRAWLQENRVVYVMGDPKNTEFTTADGDSVVIEKAAGNLRPSAWQRRACGIGAKGFRVGARHQHHVGRHPPQQVRTCRGGGYLNRE